MSEEQLELQVTKLRKELKTNSEKFLPQAQHFRSIRAAFENVLEEDSSFCDNVCDAENFDTLNDSEIAEMITSIILESVTGKEIHFSDIEKCLSQMSSVEERKESYKKVVQQKYRLHSC